MNHREAISIAVFAVAYPLLFNILSGLGHIWLLLPDLSYSILSSVIYLVIILLGFFCINLFFTKLNNLSLGLAIAVSGGLYNLYPAPLMMLSNALALSHFILTISLPVILGYILNAKNT